MDPLGRRPLEAAQEGGLSFVRLVSHFFLNYDFWSQSDLPIPSHPIPIFHYVEANTHQPVGPHPSHVHPWYCISTASVPFSLKIPLAQPGTHLRLESAASTCLITYKNSPIKLLAEGRLCQRHSARLSRKPTLLTRSRKAPCVRISLHLQYLEGTLSLISLIFHCTLPFTDFCSLLLAQQPKHTN